MLGCASAADGKKETLVYAILQMAPRASEAPRLPVVFGLTYPSLPTDALCVGTVIPMIQYKFTELLMLRELQVFYNKHARARCLRSSQNVAMHG